MIIILLAMIFFVLCYIASGVDALVKDSAAQRQLTEAWAHNEEGRRAQGVAK